MDDKIPALSKENLVLINRLREEAKAVKDCFTNFSFQTIAFSAIVLGVIAAYQGQNPLTAVGSIFVIALLLAVARIGTYKYATANRSFGYELHLYCTLNVKNSPTDRWQDYMRNIGWEEAMRAWRVVQATVFEHIYYTDILLPNFLRKRHRKAKYRWFQPAKLVVEGTGYHAGSYLSTMLGFLFTITSLSLIPMAIMSIQLKTSPATASSWYQPFLWPAFVFLSLIVLHRIIKTDVRRRVLEGGLLSIHSCAVMWQAVVVAHYLALQRTQKEHSGAGWEYENYTRNLSIVALDLKKNIVNIHEWIRRGNDLGNK